MIRKYEHCACAAVGSAPRPQLGLAAIQLLEPRASVGEPQAHAARRSLLLKPGPSSITSIRKVAPSRTARITMTPEVDRRPMP